MDAQETSLFKQLKQIFFRKSLFKKFIHYALTFLTLAYLISGIGMAHHDGIVTYTFGLLNGQRSYLIHSHLLIPFLIALVLHIYYTLSYKRKQQLKNLWNKSFTMRP